MKPALIRDIYFFFFPPSIHYQYKDSVLFICHNYKIILKLSCDHRGIWLLMVTLKKVHGVQIDMTALAFLLFVYNTVGGSLGVGGYKVTLLYTGSIGHWCHNLLVDLENSRDTFHSEVADLFSFQKQFLFLNTTSQSPVDIACQSRPGVCGKYRGQMESQTSAKKPPKVYYHELHSLNISSHNTNQSHRSTYTQMKRISHYCILITSTKANYYLFYLFY